MVQQHVSFRFRERRVYGGFESSSSALHLRTDSLRPSIPHSTLSHTPGSPGGHVYTGVFGGGVVDEFNA